MAVVPNVESGSFLILTVYILITIQGGINEITIRVNIFHFRHIQDMSEMKNVDTPTLFQ